MKAWTHLLDKTGVFGSSPTKTPLCFSKKSPTGSTEWTPKPEYLHNSSSNLLRGPLLRSHSIFDGIFCFGFGGG